MSNTANLLQLILRKFSEVAGSYNNHREKLGGFIADYSNKSNNPVVTFTPQQDDQWTHDLTVSSRSATTTTTPAQASRKATWTATPPTWRSEERRVGKESVSTCSTRWSP